MLAFGKTHDDEAIWKILAFLGVLPNLSNSDYLQLRTSVPSESRETGEFPD